MKNAGTYYIIVIEDLRTNEIVASGSLVLEKKFIHSCGQVGYNCSLNVCIYLLLIMYLNCSEVESKILLSTLIIEENGLEKCK